MRRCPECRRPAAEQGSFCAHCGAALAAAQAQAFWRAADWLDARQAGRALLAALPVFLVRAACTPLVMPYEGERHEGRVLLFHLLVALALGLAAAWMRQDRKRAWAWAGLGLGGGLLSWCLDYAYMADHRISQAVFYVLNWFDATQYNAIQTGFGILQTLRFLGPVLALGSFAAWGSGGALGLRMAVFSVLALVFRFPVRGFALAWGLIPLYPGQSALYFASLFCLLYGIGRLDSNSAK